MQPANQTTDQPASQTTDQQRGKKNKKKKRHTSTWIALASAATAIVAAAISAYQVHIAGQQNTEAEQTQLVSLTSVIAQQFTQIATATNQTSATPLAHNVAAQTNQGFAAQLQVDGQASAVLIQALNGNGVASVEYIQVARALDWTGDTTDAITYYKKALTAPPYAPGTRAQALRFLGYVYYGLGQSVTGHRYYLLATQVYRKYPGKYYRSSEAATIAQGYAEDASWQISIHNCPLAANEMMVVERLLAPYSAAYTVTLVPQADLNTDQKNYAAKCKGTGKRA